MFDGPEHQSYIALCRELMLERKLEEGDWFVLGQHTTAFVWSALITATAWNDHFHNIPEPGIARPIWLPRLDQWLAMLEEAGQPDIAFERTLAGRWECGRPIPEGDGRTIELVPTSGLKHTREEAAARLWMAVTGRT